MTDFSPVPPEENAVEGVVRFEVTDEDLGKRIDHFLAEKMKGFSRTRIQCLIREGRVRCGTETVVRNNFRIRRIVPVSLDPPPPLESSIRPEDLPVRILYEDSDLAVVEKPPGMPTHPTTLKTSGTLVNALLHHLTDLSEIGGVLRPGIVHRLDRVTSGVLVVAKNRISHERLSGQFRTRTVRKTYRAICLGRDPGEKGVVEGTIDRHPVRRNRMILGRRGRKSISKYRRVATRPPAYGLLVYPLTGRTHQIRVHLESLSCPIVPDERYGFDYRRWPFPELNPVLRNYPGIFLHAERIEFEHPVRCKPLRFESAPPEVFKEIWSGLFGTGPEIPDTNE